MDVVTLGESMVLFSPDSVGPLRYMHHFTKTIAGAESNVAIALARLGHQVGWLSRLGDDEFGLYIRNCIRGEGVDTSRVIFDLEYPTGVLFKERHSQSDPKIYYYRKGSAASKMDVEDLDERYIAQAKILHITGITPALSESCKKMIFQSIQIAKRNQLQIVFDPNIRLKLWSKDEARETLMKIAGMSDIVLPGIEEGSLLTGETSPKKIAASLLNNGSKLVVLKLGEKGAYYASEEEAGYVNGFKVEKIVDTVGAGDGFAAGFMSGLLRGYSNPKAVELGNRIGAFALTVTGDMEGYPTWSQISQEKIILR